MVIATEIIYNHAVHCRVINDNVFHAYLMPDTVISKNEIQFIVDEYQRRSAIQPMKFLMELAPFAFIDINGCEALNNSNLSTLCEAIVTNDLAQLLTINFYFRSRKRDNDSKLFKNRTQALNWLEDYKVQLSWAISNKFSVAHELVFFNFRL